MSALRFSQPGRPTRIVEDRDPYLGLTQRQRHIVETLLAHNGNRSRAARALGLTIPSVQAAVRLAERAGVRIPAGARRGPDLQPRRGSVKP